MRFQEFASQCKEISKYQPRHSSGYLANHLVRFYHTYDTAKELVGESDTILSIGAGGAYVEIMISKHVGADITVIDFPEAIRSHRDTYDKYGIDYIGSDITNHTFSRENDWDLIMACEILEHLPLAPGPLFETFGEIANRNGRVLITTPNFATLENVFKLAVGRNPQPDPEELFTEVKYENEGYHRREYTKVELCEYLEASGFKVVSSSYIMRKRWRKIFGKYKLSPKILGVFLIYILPRLRNTMIVVADPRS